MSHLCAEQGLTELEIVQAETQSCVNVPKRVYRDRQIRLEQIAESYGNLDNLRYILGHGRSEHTILERAALV